MAFCNHCAILLPQANQEVERTTSGNDEFMLEARLETRTEIIAYDSVIQTPYSPINNPNEWG